MSNTENPYIHEKGNLHIQPCPACIWEAGRTSRDQEVADLKRQLEPSPCGVAGHLRCDWHESKIVRACEELTDQMVEDGYSHPGGQGEPYCSACQRKVEERDKALVEAAKAMCLECARGRELIRKDDGDGNIYFTHMKVFNGNNGCPSSPIHRLREVKR